eukprot:UN18597
MLVSQKKWACMHYFHSFGYALTHDGFKQDVFQLASYGDTCDGDSTKCLFAKVYPLQLRYVARKEAALTQAEKLKTVDEFAQDVTKVRTAHYHEIECRIDELEKKKLMINIFNPEEEKSEDFWTDAKDKPWKRRLQLFAVDR